MIGIMGGRSATDSQRLVGGRYALEKLLGTGGMGEVWLARHQTLKTEVAIKFLQHASATHESARRRFITEAQVTAQLKTRHAVQVFDFGVTDDGQPYLVMERLEGETLAQRLHRETRLGTAVTVRFLMQVARALERAHALGIVHRDLKLHNIIIVPDEDHIESVKVVDFGIAKLLRDLEEDASRSGEADAKPFDEEPVSAETFGSFTRTGSILGTPNYMAPEQIVNAPDLDSRADIWAFGVVAFECLTGQVPFVGKSLIDLFTRVRKGDHPRARMLNPSLPEAFEGWFDRACAVDRSRRFSDARAAATELAIALGERPSMSSGAEISGPYSAASMSGGPSSAPGSGRPPMPSAATLSEGSSYGATSAEPDKLRTRIAIVVGAAVIAAAVVIFGTRALHTSPPSGTGSAAPSVEPSSTAVSSASASAPGTDTPSADAPSASASASSGAAAPPSARTSTAPRPSSSARAASSAQKPASSAPSAPHPTSAASRDLGSIDTDNPFRNR
jgi:serine/threonine-protein kinase